MNFKEYVQLAVRTKTDWSNRDEDLVHSALGINSELIELTNATDGVNRFEEIGDILWYLALASNAMTIDISSGIENTFEGSTFYYSDEPFNQLSSELSDQIKRMYFYKDTTQEKDIALSLVCLLQGMNMEYELTLEDWQCIMEMNIKKLHVRYPEKFDNDSAIIRTLDTEYSTLEEVFNKYVK